MHLQVKMSPDETAENIRRVVSALAEAGINIEAIAPDFDPPHVRVLVRHEEPSYDPGNADDPLNRALAALTNEGLEPELKAGLLVRMPNKPRVLKTALDRCASEDYVVESLLVLPGQPSAGAAWVSLGVARATIDGWEEEAEALQRLIEEELEGLPDG
jgi:hypothetical protein